MAKIKLIGKWCLIELTRTDLGNFIQIALFTTCSFCAVKPNLAIHFSRVAHATANVCNKSIFITLKPKKIKETIASIPMMPHSIGYIKRFYIFQTAQQTVVRH